MNNLEHNERSERDVRTEGGEDKGDAKGGVEWPEGGG